MDKRIGTIPYHHKQNQSAENVNAILSEFGDVIIGRMGIPYFPKSLHIIALIVHASHGSNRRPDLKVRGQR